MNIMKNSFLKTGIILGALFLSAGIYAQEPKVRKTPAEKMERLDANKDGLLSLDEVSKTKNGKMAENFSKIDSNEDGFIDITELEARAAKRENRKNREK